MISFLHLEDDGIRRYRLFLAAYAAAALALIDSYEAGSNPFHGNVKKWLCMPGYGRNIM